MGGLHAHGRGGSIFVRHDVHAASGASVCDEVSDVCAFHFGHCVSNFEDVMRRVLTVAAGVRTRGRCVGCTLECGVRVGVIVVLMGGGCGVGGMGVGVGVGVRVAGVFVRGGGGCVAGRMGLPRSMRHGRRSGLVRLIVGHCPK